MKIRTTFVCLLAILPLALMHGIAQHAAPHVEATAITSVSLFDADLHQMRRSMTVLFDRDRVLAVGPDGEVTIPSGTIRIDGHGKTLLPALVEAPTAARDDLLRLADLDGAAFGRFVALRRGFQLAVTADVTALERDLDAASFERALAVLRRLHRAGVPLATRGTVRELELWQRAGLAPLDILYDATLGAARLAHQDDRRGSIQRGKRADMLLVAGAPERSVGDLRNVVLTVRNGIVAISS